MNVSLFAETNIHISLKAEKLFTVGPITVTNSMLYGMLVALVLLFVMAKVAKRIKVKPAKGAAGPVELVMEFVLNLIEGPLGSRAMAVKYAPYFSTYFLFIMFSNLTALLPIVGPGIEYNGSPLFRPFTADLNGTIALAVIAIVMVQVMSIREQGGKNHLKHYFTDKPLNPINFFIGVLEVFGEFTRMVSLSLRLFLNTAVGEILVAVFTSMIISGGRTPLAVLPILLFEMLVAGIQAYVFTVLAATYLGLAVAHHNEHAHHEEDDAAHGSDSHAHTDTVPLKKVEEHV